MLDLMRKRRPINPQWEIEFEKLRKVGQKYGDDLASAETFEMYEALPDDKSADCIIACDILEHLPNPAIGLARINDLARKYIIIAVRPSEERTEQWWRAIIDKYINVHHWFFENGVLTAVCNSGMRVQGINPVGALTDDVRWKLVEASTKRISKRIKKEPPHNRRALIACYGPSLSETWERLRSEQQECDSVIVSMSGAHDFLIDRGIIPDYHVHCDPRPQSNLNKPHKDVKYLIASACDALQFDTLEGFDVSLWHVNVSSHAVKLIDQLKEKRETLISGGGSVGVRSISLFYAFGYRAFSIYGMDCSFVNQGTKQWAGSHVSKPQDLCVVHSGDESYITSPVLATYATNFFDLVKRMEDATFALWGDGLLQSMCRLSFKNPRLEAA